MKILIADDDPTLRIVLTAALHAGDHEVAAVDNGLEAWERLQRPDAPRVAILDWMMPGLHGPDVCQRLRAQEAHQPYLILLTARGEKQDMAAGLRVGADDYVAKPFDVLELNARVAVGCRIVALQDRLAAQVQELRTALEHIKVLRGIIPICASCKKIRDDRGYWCRVETYISEHSEAEFTHGICPDCIHKLYPEYTKIQAAEPLRTPQ